jgi:hypothetical protein
MNDLLTNNFIWTDFIHNNSSQEMWRMHVSITSHDSLTNSEILSHLFLIYWLRNSKAMMIQYDDYAAIVQT